MNNFRLPQENIKRVKTLLVLVFLILLVLLPGCLGSPTKLASLRGVIRDRFGQPLPGATITLSTDTPMSTITDATGEFSFEKILLKSPTTYSLTIEAPEGYNYRTHTDLILLKPGENYYSYQMQVINGSISGRVSFTSHSSPEESSPKDKCLSLPLKMDRELMSLPSSSIISEPYVPDELLLVFKPSVSEERIETLLKDLGWEVANKFRSNDTYLVKIPRELDLYLALEEALNLPEIWSADFNHIYTIQAFTPPNDPCFNSQWNLQTIYMPEAWETTQGNDSVIIAILDSGYSDHPDLPKGYKLVAPCSFVAEETCSDYKEDLSSMPSHGVHVAGIAGAETNNNQDIAGTAWSVRLMPIKILKDGEGTLDDLLEAIYWAVEHGAHVINLSIGFKNTTEVPLPLQYALDNAVENGLTIIAAAGNHGPGEDANIIPPASYEKVISVGAIQQNYPGEYHVAPYSNIGNIAEGRELDLVAPGTAILSLRSTSFYPYGVTTLTGTSMAAPHVSAVVALLYAQGIVSKSMGEGAYQLVRSILQESATPLQPGLDYDDSWGYGLLNAWGALNLFDLFLLRTTVVFTGIYQEGQIHLTSEIVSVYEDGRFLLDDIQPGNTIVFAWIDADENGLINYGDYLAKTDDVSVLSNQNTGNVHLVLEEVDGPISLIMD